MPTLQASCEDILKHTHTHKEVCNQLTEVNVNAVCAYKVTGAVPLGVNQAELKMWCIVMHY